MIIELRCKDHDTYIATQYKQKPTCGCVACDKVYKQFKAERKAAITAIIKKAEDLGW